MSVQTIYEDGTYYKKNPTWHEQDSPWKARQIEKMLSRNDIEPSSVCEIGCGAGEILRSLADVYGSDVMLWGYDISPQAIEICQTKERENLRFICKDLLLEQEGSFDVVMAIDVFEHVEDYWGFLRSLRNKGTYAVFHIPLDLSVQIVMRSSPIMNARRSLGHIHYFTKETALATLKDTGYEIMDYFYTKGSLELPKRSWREKLLKLPRRILFNLNEDMTVRVLGGFSLLVLAKSSV